VTDQAVSPSKSSQDVVEAALTVFAEKGFDRSTMQDVASVAGLHKSSIYHYFRSKDEMLLAVCRPTLDELLDSIDSVVRATNLSPRQRVEESFAAAADVALGHVRETNIILSQRPGSPAGDEILRHRLAYESRFADLIRDAGSLTREAAILRARVLLGTINWVLMWFRPERSSYSVDDVTTEIRSVLGRELMISDATSELPRRA